MNLNLQIDCSFLVLNEIPIIDGGHDYNMSTDKELEEESYEAITGTAEEVEAGMRSGATDGKSKTGHERNQKR